MGSCEEGFGQATFEEWLTESESPQEVINRLAAGFRLGGHKAAAMAQVMLRADVYLVSHMPDDLVRDCHMVPFASVQEALNDAVDRVGTGASILLMPHAGSTLPLTD